MQNVSHPAKWIHVLLWGCAVVGSAVEASAQEGLRTCLVAYDDAQTLRQAGHLTQSQKQLLICAQADCPATVRDDCGRWLIEVEQSLPTVVLQARGPDGRDVLDVTVTVDGQPFASHLDGKALPLDPGPHKFRFELPASPPVDEQVIIYESVKNRRIDVQFRSAEPIPPEPPAAPAPVAPTPPKPASPSRVSTVAYVLGGVGVLGLGLFTYFGLSFDDQLDDLDRCAPSCPDSDVERASRTRAFALTAGGVGLVSLGLATALWVSGRPGAQRAERRAASRWSAAAVPGGMIGAVRVRF